ncbi:MAG: hypothetical protein ACLTG4_07270 [Oscillospiraceae bacterium]
MSYRERIPNRTSSTRHICARSCAHFTAAVASCWPWSTRLEQNEADSEKLRGYLRAMGFDFDGRGRRRRHEHRCEHAETRVS